MDPPEGSYLLACSGSGESGSFMMFPLLSKGRGEGGSEGGDGCATSSDRHTAGGDLDPFLQPPRASAPSAELSLELEDSSLVLLLAITACLSLGNCASLGVWYVVSSRATAATDPKTPKASLISLCLVPHGLSGRSVSSASTAELTTFPAHRSVRLLLTRRLLTTPTVSEPRPRFISALMDSSTTDLRLPLVSLGPCLLLGLWTSVAWAIHVSFHHCSMLASSLDAIFFTSRSLRCRQTV
mmetsp:Transcript_52920/g.149063  ORF Transcript_52920/g.149063 Transcript_52920/m.149063 type:complete len:240 (+) Transcript_52920:168-887(+)